VTEVAGTQEEEKERRRKEKLGVGKLYIEWRLILWPFILFTGSIFRTYFEGETPYYEG